MAQRNGYVDDVLSAVQSYLTRCMGSARKTIYYIAGVVRWLGDQQTPLESVLGFGDVMPLLLLCSSPTCFALRSLLYEGGPGAMIPN